ncbi:MAG: hypothetical protein H6773_02965 [Pseudomonadales bacterium]|nr:hypothetical protein [Candidatus Woesebacteria bacterium]MCB9801118.1 hypothetical protein [Pseudomonadales bacterium]
MEVLEQIYLAVFSVNSIWSVVFRGIVWFIVAGVIIVSLDKADPDSAQKNLKSNLGFLLMFLVLSGVLMYLLFGYSRVA